MSGFNEETLFSGVDKTKVDEGAGAAGKGDVKSFNSTGEDVGGDLDTTGKGNDGEPDEPKENGDEDLNASKKGGDESSNSTDENDIGNPDAAKKGENKAPSATGEKGPENFNVGKQIDELRKFSLQVEEVSKSPDEYNNDLVIFPSSDNHPSEINALGAEYNSKLSEFAKLREEVPALKEQMSGNLTNFNANIEKLSVLFDQHGDDTQHVPDFVTTWNENRNEAEKLRLLADKHNNVCDSCNDVTNSFNKLLNEIARAFNAHDQLSPDVVDFFNRYSKPSESVEQENENLAQQQEDKNSESGSTDGTENLNQDGQIESNVNTGDIVQRDGQQNLQGGDNENAIVPSEFTLNSFTLDDHDELPFGEFFRLFLATIVRHGPFRQVLFFNYMIFFLQTEEELSPLLPQIDHAIANSQEESTRTYLRNIRDDIERFDVRRKIEFIKKNGELYDELFFKREFDADKKKEISLYSRIISLLRYILQSGFTEQAEENIKKILDGMPNIGTGIFFGEMQKQKDIGAILAMQKQMDGTEMKKGSLIYSKLAPLACNELSPFFPKSGEECKKDEIKVLVELANESKNGLGLWEKFLLRLQTLFMRVVLFFNKDLFEKPPQDAHYNHSDKNDSLGKMLPVEYEKEKMNENAFGNPAQYVGQVNEEKNVLK